MIWEACTWKRKYFLTIRSFLRMQPKLGIIKYPEFWINVFKEILEQTHKSLIFKPLFEYAISNRGYVELAE